MTRPISQRHCIHCNRLTIFKYDPNIGHSHCIECGYRFGIKKSGTNYEKVLEQKIKEKDEKIEEIRNELNKIKTTMHSLKGTIKVLTEKTKEMTK